uniref:Uncharacterized protein n=1 Tax=Anopheles dirus TaxID=7168 RepID=A0A182NW96_9DIPT
PQHVHRVAVIVRPNYVLLAVTHDHHHQTVVLRVIFLRNLSQRREHLVLGFIRIHVYIEAHRFRQYFLQIFTILITPFAFQQRFPCKLHMVEDDCFAALWMGGVVLRNVHLLRRL